MRHARWSRCARASASASSRSKSATSSSPATRKRSRATGARRSSVSPARRRPAPANTFASSAPPALPRATTATATANGSHAAAAAAASTATSPAPCWSATSSSSSPVANIARSHGAFWPEPRTARSRRNCSPHPSSKARGCITARPATAAASARSDATCELRLFVAGAFCRGGRRPGRRSSPASAAARLSQRMVSTNHFTPPMARRRLSQFAVRESFPRLPCRARVT